MKYYIVALFDEESYNVITPIQRKFSKKFRANRNSPIPYIALNVMENPNVEKLNPIIEKVLKPYKKFKIELCDNVSICESMRTINLKIEDIGYIRKICRSLTDTLELHGFNLKSSPKEELAISLANINYFNKDSKKHENDSACDPLEKDGKNLTLKIDRVELWKISNNKKETCLKTYTLKDF
ncbi:hypothetical protein ACQPU1_16825 [Clostridium paraputrificum]|uniref:hypothetical protein n=1 Tax=Clostridium TaxID=1485 RepID=UPI003D344549